jgi:hypothetical protein
MPSVGLLELALGGVRVFIAIAGKLVGQARVNVRNL